MMHCRPNDDGLEKMAPGGRVRSVSERPQGVALKEMRVNTTVLGLPGEKAKEFPCIASRGIYVFEKQVLHDLLNAAPDRTDFGKEILPASLSSHNVQAYLFKDYWEDIGTIEAFYHANLALTAQPDPPFSFYDENSLIYIRARDL